MRMIMNLNKLLKGYVPNAVWSYENLSFVKHYYVLYRLRIKVEIFRMPGKRGDGS